MRVEWEPRVTKVPGHDAGLVLLMVVHPQLDHRLRSFHIDQGTGSSRLRFVAGFGSGAVKGKTGATLGPRRA